MADLTQGESRDHHCAALIGNAGRGYKPQFTCPHSLLASAGRSGIFLPSSIISLRIIAELQ